MRAADLIAVARLLAQAPGGGTAQETRLRRAVSTAYYALFHCLSENCADLLAGRMKDKRRNEEWLRVYRSLNHRKARNRCRNQASFAQLPQPITDFAEQFVELQRLRHEADYNPAASFEPARVMQNINDSEARIRAFNAVPAAARRAFVLYLLIDPAY